MYKLNKDITTGNINSVSKFNEDGSGMCIPFDPANTDYQKYLQWLSEGNIPTPPDEVTE